MIQYAVHPRKKRGAFSYLSEKRGTLTTTRTRRIKTTTTTEATTPTEEAITEPTAAELRKQISNADDAMRALNLRISDLQEQIDALTTTEEDISHEQEARTDSIRSLQTEIGQLSLELEDLKVDVAIK